MYQCVDVGRCDQGIGQAALRALHYDEAEPEVYAGPGRVREGIAAGVTGEDRRGLCRPVPHPPAVAIRQQWYIARSVGWP